ncbi:GFA family protein [Roseiterribacter gracilis]|uniref:Aldehyde-activating protein n=1 Tax=Roseiterribacter gracilis TaxID=2812848 RepID=A0A8S8XKN9_9PROT|nr:aldehyde-activating protein [Rhodospirillales bacterium TMPK1]
MKRTYRGACHCGAVQFEAALDLQAGTSRCNCSICAKHRFWKAFVPKDEFRLLQGGDATTEYQFGSHNVHHIFCATCGVKPFGSVDMQGGLYAINVACLDVSDEERATAPVAYENGRDNDWGSPPAVTSHL